MDTVADVAPARYVTEAPAVRTKLFVTMAPSTRAAQYTVPENVAAVNVAISVMELRVFVPKATVRTGAAGSNVGATASKYKTNTKQIQKSNELKDNFEQLIQTYSFECVTG